MQVLCNHQRFIQVQHIVKPCLVFGIKDVVAVSQQYPARALDYLTLVHVFLCIPQLAAQLAYPLIHEFYHMKIIHYKRVFDGSTDNTSFYLVF